ncbi:MAG: radical SAM protein [Candidatus Eisenbacteria bacterium]|nr:radical SAM protein [Candidatus Eisenbacteria bacterium]
MREPGAILLVSCYELGHQPLALASASAFLARAGFAPATLDLSVEPMDVSRVARARMIAISVPMHTALRLGMRAAAEMRALNGDAHIAYVGLYAGLNAGWLLERGADSAIGSEWEGPLVALTEALDAGDAAPVVGVSVPGRITGPHLARLEFPVPARDGLPALERYARLAHDGALALTGYVEASRGCRHTCRHCPIPPAYDGRFFAVPREVVAKDVAQQVAAGAAHITFGDPDFLNAPTHALRVARDLHAAHPSLTFDFTAKIEHVIEHAALFPELARLGALFMVSAVESLSDTVLAHLAKGHTRADVFQALAIARAAGIVLRPSLVAFTPWTTLDDYLDVLDTAEREDLIDAIDPVQYTIRLLLPPGSLLLEHDAMRPHLTGFDVAAFGHRWAHPDPRMDALHLEVTALVAGATRAGEDPAVTFARIRDRARQIAGRSVAAARDATPAPRPFRAPRLTEPWFC